MKILLSTFGLFTLALTACGTVNPTTVEPVETVETPVVETPAKAETYTWEKHGISFEVPEGLVVSDMAYIDALYLAEQDMSMAEGDNPGEINIYPYTDKTVEQLLEQYSVEDKFMQSVAEAGGKTFTYVTYYSDFGNYMPELYLIENNGTVYVITKHWDGDLEDMKVILESLEF